RISTRQRGVAIRGRVRLPRRQAAVSFTRNMCAVRVDLVEVFENRADGIVEAVKIEPVKRNTRRVLKRGVVMAKPIDERAYLVVAPHPDREAGKSGPLRRRILQMSHIVIDPRGVRPVVLDGHKSEALLRDQLARDALAHPVKFRRAMGGLTEQYDSCVANAREQQIQLCAFDRVEWFTVISDGLGQGLVPSLS